MRLTIFNLALLLLTLNTNCAQSVDDDLKYLGQQLTTLQPEIFAPGLISKGDEYEFGSVFNKDATAFYYAVDTGENAEIRFTKLKDGAWTTPKVILSHDEYGFNDPFLSPDEQRLYFISRRATTGSGAKGDYDIWYVEKRRDAWSEPFNAGPNINSEADEYYISFTQDGTMYFASDKETDGESFGGHDIYASKSVNGAFQPATNLGAAINTKAYEADVFVAPDESYVIFCATRAEGLGRGDLYISFKNDDGTWTKSINMGNKINTEGHELCPFVSADGKYFFYTSKQDIYWVSTEFLDALRERSE